ncbi:MAG: right-handed parallel beta-helix repeat-containing protein [Geobacteraceae bacterium]|nr:right-handed parallel beta-helix repeat-containing protein [Geobacteraceae bacterium]
MFSIIIAGVIRIARAVFVGTGPVISLFVTAFVLISPAKSLAQTYYVDATDGNDSNSGFSSSRSWKTISKVNGSKFQPGDFILFRRGCVWREMLIVPSSGTAGNTITFGAYGLGAKPVISGADIVGARGWSLYGGKIFVTNVNNMNASPTQLYVDGTYYDTAHYPNSGYLMATANSSNKNTITDAKLGFTVDKVVGATVKVREVPWLIDTSAVTAFNLMTRTLSINASLSYAMRAGYGYYLQNKLWMLDSPKEWYFDPKAFRLYLWTVEGDIPNWNKVEVSNRSYGIVNAAKNYVTIRDLVVFASNRYNVYISGASNVIVDNCDIRGGQVGIFLANTTSSSIRNNSVRDTLSTGISTDWNTANNLELLNNSINSAGNVGSKPKNSLAGIYVNGDNVNIKNNTVTNSGYIGISIGGHRITVQDNIVDRSCIVLDDCGGIYATNDGASNKITGNTISNSAGNFIGTAYNITQAHGIYLDDLTHDTIVSGNIVSNADYGIFIHTGYNNTITGNSVFNARMNGLLMNENGSDAVSGTVHGNLVNNNIFEVCSTGATAYYYSIKGSTDKFGTFDMNRYCHPNSVFTVRNQSQNYTLPAWQQASGQDLNSTDMNAACAAPSPTVTLAATPVTVAAYGSSILTWSSTNSITCVAGGAWSGAKPASGSLEISNLTGSETFTLTCSGRGGATTRVTTITVH